MNRTSKRDIAVSLMVAGDSASHLAFIACLLSDDKSALPYFAHTDETLHYILDTYVDSEDIDLDEKKEFQIVLAHVQQHLRQVLKRADDYHKPGTHDETLTIYYGTVNE